MRRREKNAMISLVFMFIVVHLDGVMGNKEEVRLLDDIFRGYNNRARPVRNISTTTQLQFGIALKQILDVDERDQIITTNVWVRQYWNDEYLTWNKSEYGNIDAIRVDPSMIWKPDLRLYNTAQENFKGIDVESKTRATIYSNGLVVWLSPHILKSVCKMDVTYFPFDEQHCEMIFASWAYHGGQVIITNRRKTADLSNYAASGEFELVSFNVVQKIKKYPCCPEPYPELHYTLHLRRLARFYLMNTILPSTLISFLAFLSFALPPDSGERIGLVITTLLSLAVFMMIISDQIPPTSEVFPLLQKFLTAVMLEIGIALVANCVVIAWAARDQPPSELIRKIFSFEFLKTLVRWRKKVKVAPQNKGDTNQGHFHGTKAEIDTSNENENKKADDSRMVSTLSWEKKMLTHLQKISNAAAMKKNQEKIASEWKLAASTLDRLCIVLFLLTIFITLAFFFISAPRITL